MGGCTKCSRDGTVCLECPVGKYLFSTNNNGIYNNCVSCNLPSQYKVRNQSGTETGYCDYCSNAVDFCENCNNDPLHCLTCKANTYLWSTDAVAADYEECSRCFSNTYYQENGICKPCDVKFSNCLTCSADGSSCTKCKINNYFLAGACVSCTARSQFIDSGVPSDGSGSCSLCSSEIVGCQYCDGDKTKCAQCNAGLFRWDPAADGVYTQCIACSETNRVKSGSSGGVEICARCSSLMPNCATCNPAGTVCTQCSAGKFLQATVLGGLVNSCTLCDSDRKYKVDKTIVDGTGQCNFCTESITGCNICNVDAITTTRECLWCNPALYLFKSTASLAFYDQCVACTEGTYFKRNEG